MQHMRTAVPAQPLLLIGASDCRRRRRRTPRVSSVQPLLHAYGPKRHGHVQRADSLILARLKELRRRHHRTRKLEVSACGNPRPVMYSCSVFGVARVASFELSADATVLRPPIARRALALALHSLEGVECCPYLGRPNKTKRGTKATCSFMGNGSVRKTFDRHRSFKRNRSALG